MNFNTDDIIVKRHFGPYILRHKCPESIFNMLNEYTDRVSLDKNLSKVYSSKNSSIPNLLKRDFESIYLDYDFAENIGFCDYVTQLGLKYLKHVSENSFDDFGNEECSFFMRDLNPKLSKINSDNETFHYAKDLNIADAWINRYFSGDFTPLHVHGADLSGIIFLKISDELKGEQIDDIHDDKDLDYREYLIKNNIKNYKPNGSVLFNYHNNVSILNNGTYQPIQDNGTVLLFPSFLTHLVYPQKVNVERRTLSFNICLEG